MKEREVRRYLGYLGVGPGLNKSNGAYEKRSKRSLSDIIRAVFKPPTR